MSASSVSSSKPSSLAGAGNRIKAYTIATDALGRDARFDPQADPIVRVEAGRLRRTLEHYYATEGRGDPIVIELPSGSYVPVFRPNIAPHGASPGCAVGLGNSLACCATTTDWCR